MDGHSSDQARSIWGWRPCQKNISNQQAIVKRAGWFSTCTQSSGISTIRFKLAYEIIAVYWSSMQSSSQRTPLAANI